MIRPLLLLCFLAGTTALAGDSDKIQRTLYDERDVYTAWPSIIRAANGDIVATLITTEQHLGPDASVTVMRSADNGATWSEPFVGVDTILDDREGGLTLTPDGELLMHVWATHWKPEQYHNLAPGSYPQAWIERWAEHVAQPAYANATDLAGGFIYSSTDHGKTWQKKMRGPDSTHGGIALQDGSLLVASYREQPDSIHIHRTPDADTPWEKIHVVPSPLEPHQRFGEPHVAQLPSGRIVVMTRSTARVYDDERGDLFMWSVYSDDNGETWSEPFPTPMMGYPPHLLTLSDGRLLCSYGRRKAPYGIRAMVSEDGVSWTHANEIILRQDAPNHDLGYPASVELEPGRILTIFYQKPDYNPDNKHDHTTALFGTEWTLPPADY